MSARLLPAALAGLAAGILGQDAGLIDGGQVAALYAIATLVASAATVTRRSAIAAAAALVLFVAIGAWRGAGTALPIGPGSLSAVADGSEASIVGTVVDDPRPRGERQQAVLEDVEVRRDNARSMRVAGRLLAWLPRSAAVGAGDRISFTAAIEEPQDFDGVAYRAYLARQGIAATCSAFRATVVGHRASAVGDALLAVRRWLLSGLNAIVPEPEAALADGILLGVRSGIAPDVADAFSAAGLTHVVAISGWNIAIVASLAGAATAPLRRLQGGRIAAVLLAAGAVAAYVALTGASPSVVRAALMAGAIVLARAGGSRAHALSALMLAALVMLLAAPPLLWDVGFQLSALATGGLVLFGAAVERRLPRWPPMIREPIALTLAAQLTTLPVIVLNFERLSLVAPLANVVVVPLVPIVMLCSALAALVGGVTEALAVPVLGDVARWAAGGTAWLFLRAMILAGTAAAAVPFASVDVGSPTWLAAAWYPLLLPLRARMARAPVEDQGPAPPASPGTGALRPRRMAFATLALLAGLTAASRPDGQLHLIALDVGQGDAILVRAPNGATALIDGGPDPDLLLRRLGEVLPFWQRDLEIVVMTHPHEDHVAGLVPALERFDVALVVEPGRPYDNPAYDRFLTLGREEPGGTYRLARAGDRYVLGGAVALTVLYPAASDATAALPEGDINNSSVVMLLTDGAFRALLTGDAEAPVERALLDRGELGRVDVLKVGHHGSDSSTTPAFLDALAPRIALISVGRDNEYGHPHASTLAHLAARPGLTVMRTDLEGTIDLAIGPGATVAVSRHPHDPGSIGPWAFPARRMRRRSWRRRSCRTGSWSTRAVLRASRQRPRAWSPPRAFPSRSSSSRGPPCCTTSTSSRRVGMA